MYPSYEDKEARLRTFKKIELASRVADEQTLTTLLETVDDSILEELDTLKELGFRLPGIAKKLLKGAENVGIGTVKGIGRGIGGGAESIAKSVAKAITGDPGAAVKQVEKNANIPQAVEQVKQVKSSDTFKEGEHPRGPDGKFVDKSKGSVSKAVNTTKAVAGAIVDKQYQADFNKWAAERDAFDRKELDAKAKGANHEYDNADSRLRLVEKYKAQLTDATRLGVDEKELKKIRSNIDKNTKKAEDYRLKGDNIWKKPSKTYDVPQPPRPTGFKGFKPAPPPPPKGTGVGLIPKPTMKIPPKTQPQQPGKVPRLTPIKKGK